MDKPDKCIEAAPPSSRRKMQIVQAEEDGWDAYPDGKMPDYDPPRALEKRQAFRQGWGEADAYYCAGKAWSTDE